MRTTSQVKTEIAKVYVVDDDAGMRDSLEMLLRAEGYQVESYPDADAFLEVIGKEACGCLIADLRMPGMSGLTLQREMHSRGIQLPVIFITGHGDVGSAVQAMKRGAIDFIEKPFANEVILDRIQLCMQTVTQLQQERQHKVDILGRLEQLTPREREVMEYVVQGYSSKEIGRRLDISPKTVDIHRGRILDKLGASSVANLIHLTAHLLPKSADR